ncbi:hypothetical protein PHLGIDRAFT_100918 [Phlebiopsis gigantea 11061_1 CR5-6]|uniref:Polynucleotide 5'-hydroxyl-kinase GRC3 n=1 Tax=Phlebiopsis gigantea (strain 11061_1 CR5-6) TaxID=745531 RepID=A0A0C3S493_PHLG1|nr:hypothetical protein PHLGIDRAFT_100918 [Phlebiopsis gigantea 11061_1 CR5-6]
MLSAVAARKARLQQTAPPPEPPRAQSSPPSSEAEDVHAHAKPPKRKSSAPAPKAARKKRRVNRPQDTKLGRYFTEKDGFKEQQDVIAVADDDSDEERAWSPSAPFQDSSDEEDAGATPDFAVLNPPAAPLPAEEPPQILSTFRPILGQNFFHVPQEELEAIGMSPLSPTKLLVLRSSDRLALLGTYSLALLRGAVRLNGVQLTPSPHAHPVFSPRSSPLPVIEYAPGAQDSEPTTLLPSRFVGAVTPGDAVVLLQELRTGVEGLGRVCRTFEDVFSPTRWQKNQSTIDLGLQGVHYVTLQSADSQPFLLPRSWERALDAVCSAGDSTSATDLSRQVFAVHGAKKTGKSTLARTLVNRLLARYQRVAFLECDLGQSEFTPGGMVALNILDAPVFGPPFTHPSIPHHAHYIGATTPRNCPSQYLEAISALMQTYNIDVQYASQLDGQTDDGRIAEIIPLVVNMMGWTKGLGADLSRKILDIAQPSVVFDFEAPQPENGWYTPADHRTLSILSYFHAVFPSAPPLASESAGIYATSWNTSLPLCAQHPYELTSDTALDSVILSGPGFEDVVPSEVHHVLNGAVVGLVRCEPGALDLETASSARGIPYTGIPYTRGMPPPPPSASSCPALALVRSTSSAAPARLHVLTPLPPAHLAAAPPRVLVKGELELPVWGMLDFRTEDAVAGVERARVPFLRWGKTEGTGGERRRVRRNLMRRGQQ